MEWVSPHPSAHPERQQVKRAKAGLFGGFELTHAAKPPRASVFQLQTMGHNPHLEGGSGCIGPPAQGLTRERKALTNTSCHIWSGLGRGPQETAPEVPLCPLRLWQPEPPHDGRPPLLHLLCSGGDPAQPRGAEPPGAPYATGSAWLRPQAGGRLAGEGPREWGRLGHLWHAGPLMASEGTHCPP